MRAVASRGGDAAPPGRGGRLRRLLRIARPRVQRRQDVPARTPRCPRTGGTCRSATTAGPAPSSVSGTPVTRPNGQRKAPDESAPTYGPSTRLDIEAELGFVVGAPSEHGAPVPFTGLRRPRLRRHRAQRLVGARHPGVGVRPARAVPRQVVRDLDLAVGDAAGRARRRLGGAARAGPGATPLPRSRRDARPRHRRGGRAERRGGQPAAVPHHVLVASPDARAPDRERRLAAHG